MNYIKSQDDFNRFAKFVHIIHFLLILFIIIIIIIISFNFLINYLNLIINLIFANCILLILLGLLKFLNFPFIHHIISLIVKITSQFFLCLNLNYLKNQFLIRINWILYHFFAQNLIIFTPIFWNQYYLIHFKIIQIFSLNKLVYLFLVIFY